MTKEQAVTEILLEWGSHKHSKAYEILDALNLLPEREMVIKGWRQEVERRALEENQ